MPHTVTLDEAKAHLEELVAAAGRGEECVIAGPTGLPAAKLTPLTEADGSSPEHAHASLIGLMKGRIKLLPGWDDPLEDLKPYME